VSIYDDEHNISLCVQEGTLKKINKDMNEKTTRNIQEGLPFTIENVKKQTESKKLLDSVCRFCFFQ